MDTQINTTEDPKETHFPRLFQLIEHFGLNEKQVSEATGISSGNISDWKSGRSRPTASKAIVLANFFGCSVDYLLGRTEEIRYKNLDMTKAETLMSTHCGYEPLEKLVIKPFMRNKLYFIYDKNYEKLLDMYSYDDNFDKTAFAALFSKEQGGYSFKNKIFVELVKMHDKYRDYCFTKLLDKIK